MKRSTPHEPDPAIVVGSGNVWEDLGYPEPERMLAKSELVTRIEQTIRARRLTQAKAAALMGLDQPKVSRLLHGDFRGFSVERLLGLLAALGHDVRIVIGPTRRAHRPGRISVVTRS